MASDGYGTHGSIEIESALGGTQTVTLSDHRTQRINLGPVPAPLDVSSWHFHIDAIAPSGATTHDLDLSQLEDWRDIPEIASDTTLNNENAALAAAGNPAYGTGPTPLTPVLAVALRAYRAEQARLWRHEEARSHEQNGTLRHARENAGIGPGAEAEAAAEWRETASPLEARNERQGAGPEPQDVRRWN